MAVILRQRSALLTSAFSANVQAPPFVEPFGLSTVIRCELEPNVPVLVCVEVETATAPIAKLGLATTAPPESRTLVLNNTCRNRLSQL